MQDAYEVQIRKGCDEKCLRVFCYVCYDERCVTSLAHVLSAYGDKFLCANIRKTVAEECLRGYRSKGCIAIDFYFHVVSLLGENSCKPRSLVKMPSSEKNAVCFSSVQNEHSRSRDSVNTAQQPDAHTSLHQDPENHAYCKFVGKEFLLEEEIHLLEGLLYILLERFCAKEESFVRLFAIRIFNVVCKHRPIKSSYLHTLTQLFDNVWDMYKNIAQGGDAAQQGCTASTCFINPAVTQDDHKSSVDAVVGILENIAQPNIRENLTVETSLKILKILYLTNERMHFHSYERFYLPNFSTRIDVNEEFIFYKIGEKSIFTYTFVLPLSKKSDFIKYENSDLVKESLQETFFRALFEGEKAPYLFVKVDRKTTYAETLKLLKKTSSFDLRKQVKVTFRTEEGQDQGGIKKEYFQLLSEEIKEERRLFEPKSKSIWFRLNSVCQRSEFVSIGKIIAIALYNNAVLNLPFPTLFFKRLLNKTTDLADLAEIEPELFASLTNMLRLSSVEIESCDLTFEITYGSGTKVFQKSLVKDGSSVRVTAENVGMFVERYAKFLTADCVEQYMKLIRKGFITVIQPISFEFLHAKELEKIIVGSKYIDIRKLRSECVYRGYNPDSDIVVWFWETVDAYNNDMKEKLLQFCTGSGRMPITSVSMNFVIMKNGCDTERLPSAQTCFNILMLPEYDTKEKLAQKMSLAINHTKGFYLV